ncbi:low molecular weight phosphotyrosine protein phosphatase [Parahaliea sp. F7430]|uniref:protein-tyrosine-phosphatase n=1 Tax=Sediminihaliea albiluteola TaxID=2758564 RepID=A0A7W2YII7_9GAMM|nr:low molecular weight phosphotyrosine protein phosphatase [Sediminihaliea albiluteola]
MSPTTVLFVCLGNICRSPTAHGVFEQLVMERGLGDQITVDSCGTADWHSGKGPDPRTVAEAKKRGYDLSSLRARQVEASDFKDFDYIIAMDSSNLADLKAMQPADFSGRLALFLDFAPELAEREVPDPYYGEHEGFSHVLDLVEQASAGLLSDILNAPGN